MADRTGVGAVLLRRFCVFNYGIDRGYPVELARTMSINTLVIMEIFYLFFIRNLYGTSLVKRGTHGTNKVLWLVFFISLAAQFMITYVPIMQRVFATQSIPPFDILLIIGIGVILFIILEIEKQIRLHLSY